MGQLVIIKVYKKLVSRFYKDKISMSISALERLNGLNLDQCPICTEPFDNQQHQPQLICIRHHNICKTCAKNKFQKCPLCNKKILQANLINPNKYYKAFMQYDKQMNQQLGQQQGQLIQAKNELRQIKVLVKNEKQQRYSERKKYIQEKQQDARILQKIRSQSLAKLQALKKEGADEIKKQQNARKALQQQLYFERRKRLREKSPLEYYKKPRQNKKKDRNLSKQGRCQCGHKLKFKFIECPFCKTKNY